MRVDICVFSFDPPIIEVYVDKPVLFETLPESLLDDFRTEFVVGNDHSRKFPWIKLNGHTVMVDSNAIETIVNGIILLDKQIGEGDIKVISKAIEGSETLIKNSVKTINKWFESHLQLRLMFNEIEQ